MFTGTMWSAKIDDLPNGQYRLGLTVNPEWIGTGDVLVKWHGNQRPKSLPNTRVNDVPVMYSNDRKRLERVMKRLRVRILPQHT